MNTTNTEATTTRKRRDRIETAAVAKMDPPEEIKLSEEANLKEALWSFGSFRKIDQAFIGQSTKASKDT